jgi:hypothetical protein
VLLPSVCAFVVLTARGCFNPFACPTPAFVMRTCVLSINISTSAASELRMKHRKRTLASTLCARGLAGSPLLVLCAVNELRREASRESLMKQNGTIKMAITFIA